MMKPTLTAAEAYVILLQEQFHQEISKNVITDNQDSIACRIEKKKYYDGRNKEKGEYHGKRQTFFCEHCKVTGHTQDRCWKLHGYPSKVKSNTWKKENKVASNGTNVECMNLNSMHVATSENRLSNEQIGQLLSLLNK